MIDLSLCGGWEFRRADGGNGAVGGDNVDDAWRPARVPGTVHTDLLDNGLIPDPFFGDNESRVRWVSECDWEYRRMFSASVEMRGRESVSLVCDGLDALAEVSLNGAALGRADNMHRQWRWDVRDALRADGNELRVLFRSPLAYVSRRQAARPMPGVDAAIPGGPHLRKAACHFGWDWGIQAPTVGVWRDIRLEGRDGAKLSDVYLRQKHSGGAATVLAEVAVEHWSGAVPVAKMKVSAPSGESLESSAPVGDVAGRGGETTALSVRVDRPELWNPNGLGGPGERPLYEVVVWLERAGRVLDRKDFRVGLRTIALRREPDEWGESFEFVVNGQPMFAKGANWIPPDAFIPRADGGRLEQLVRAAAESNQNMLRVWGGGVYESERFYDLCDRLGILVWQDFPFACGVYPLDDAGFVENVRREAEDNARRIRHRACLALWCGNNEMEEGWAHWGWDFPGKSFGDGSDNGSGDGPGTDSDSRPQKPQAWAGLSDSEAAALSATTKAAYDEFFHRTLPGWMARLDPDTPYWPSSPSSGAPFFVAPRGEASGDAHYWEVWHGRRPFSAYRGRFPRFMSEFGFQSLPPLETVRAFADESEWNIASYAMDFHQRSPSGNAAMLSQMADNFLLPPDFAGQVWLSGVLQAEGIRAGVEHWRRNMRRVGGTLYWQLNDCWPGASWSSLDYFGRWKALHYATRRFYAPLLLCVEDAPPRMTAHLCNDRRAEWTGEFRWSLETTDGDVLRSGREAVRVGALSSVPIAALDFGGEVNDDNRRGVVFVAELRESGTDGSDGTEALCRQVVPFVPNKHLQLSDPGLSVQASDAGSGGDGRDGRVAVTVSAESLARFAELKLPGRDVVFSDNYFDIPAGRSVRVECPLPEGMTVGEFERGLEVRSLWEFAH